MAFGVLCTPFMPLCALLANLKSFTLCLTSRKYDGNKIVRKYRKIEKVKGKKNI